MSKITPKLLKGFRDFSTSEQSQRQTIFTKVMSVFERFGFSPLSTPVLEYKEILVGKYGEDEKLIYSFKDNGDRDVALRYDLTVPLARYVAQNFNQLTFPFKRYQIAPVWRADKPQKGRFREFYQCDVDILGTESVLADAEVIACVVQTLQGLGLNNLKVRISDRKILEKILESCGIDTDSFVDVTRAIDKIDKIGIDKALAQISSVPEESIQKLSSFFNQLKDGNSFEVGKDLIGEGSISPIEMLLQTLFSMGVPKDIVVFDPTIARGLDYYTGTVFEIVDSANTEYGSIASGGRYDSLLDQYSDQSLPAVGGSIGIDRLFDLLVNSDISIEAENNRVVIFNLSDEFTPTYLKVASELRGKDLKVDMYYEPAKLDKQFKYAESKNFRYAVIIGEDEIQKGTAQVKDLKNRTQVEVAQAELFKSLS